MDDISRTLDQQISNDLAVLADCDPGSEKRKEVQDRLAELYELRTNERKNEAEIESQNWARGIKLALEAAGLVVPNAIVVWGLTTCLKFEKEGVVRSGMTRQVLGMLKPAKLLKLIRL